MEKRNIELTRKEISELMLACTYCDLAMAEAPKDRGRYKRLHDKLAAVIEEQAQREGV